MTQLKIASWNVFGGQEVGAITSCLKSLDADVVGLQEVLQEEDGSANVAQAVAEALGYEWAYAKTELLEPSRSYLLGQLGLERRMGWGNAILSKFPIAETRTHILSETRARTAIEGIVTVNGAPLHVFSTHLVHGNEAASAIRQLQVETLLTLVPAERAIVMGDFNATPGSEAIRAMEKVLTNTEPDLKSCTIGFHTDKFFPPDGSGPERLDYIFTTRDLSASRSGVRDSDASDHLPVYATVEVS